MLRSSRLRPSAIGLSFLANMERETDGFKVELVGIGRLGADEFSECPAATYKKVIQKIGDIGGKEFDRSIWLRRPLAVGDGSFPQITFRTGDLAQVPLWLLAESASPDSRISRWLWSRARGGIRNPARLAACSPSR